MRLGKLLLAATLLLSTFTFAQDENRECRRMRKIANDAMGFENFKEAATFFYKGMEICGDDFKKDDQGADIGDANYMRLISSLVRVYNSENDAEVKKKYADTLVEVYNKTEAAGVYNNENDLKRAFFILQCSAPDYNAADKFFIRGIETEGTAVKEMYISLHYYNTYTLFYIEQDAEKKTALKQRMIKDYFKLSALVSKANFSVKTQETLTGYLNAVVQSCEDLLPEIPGFMKSLPEDNEAKKSALMNMVQLMEDKKCEDSKEYMGLINSYLEVDPESPVALKMKVKALLGNKQYSDAIATLKKLKELAETDEEKDELQYEIARAYFNTGQYNAAYTAGKAVGGEHRGDGLAIAGQCVGKTAMDCGNSTFERKCNYIYAVQLLEQAQANGASGISSVIASYKKNFPTTDDCFNNGSPSSQSLSCWGVSVSPCN